MSVQTSLWLFMAVHAVGLSIWLTLAAMNNARAFSGSVAAVGATMAMLPLREPPAVPTPLLSRAVGAPLLHRAALTGVLTLQIGAAIACWWGSYALVMTGDLTAARPWLNLALTGFATFLLAMHLGGLWFGYWIKQEGLQQTHLTLLIWVVIAFFLFNTPWA